MAVYSDKRATDCILRFVKYTSDTTITESIHDESHFAFVEYTESSAHTHFGAVIKSFGFTYPWCAGFQAGLNTQSIVNINRR